MYVAECRRCEKRFVCTVRQVCGVPMGVRSSWNNEVLSFGTVERSDNSREG